MRPPLQSDRIRGIQCNICYMHAHVHVHVCARRYTKGTQERGHILGSVDDIVLTLDDNAMNLQSMSASRYVGPFFEKVQKWEKSLSHISEVVDVSNISGDACASPPIILREKLSFGVHINNYVLQLSFVIQNKGCVL